MGYQSYRCIRCQSSFDLHEVIERCRKCSSPVIIEYDLEFVDVIKQQIMGRSGDLRVWRYSDLLPHTDPGSVVTLGEGWTHLHRSERLSSEAAPRRLFLKDETTNPTGSFIDRGSTVIISKAKELSAKTLACATTGNLGASIAAYAAKAGVNCRLVTTKNVDVGKLFQMLAFGASIEVCSNYEKAVGMVSSISDAGAFKVSPTNPFLLEGLKTCCFEICEQMHWRAPEYIAVPMGNGGLITMIWKALLELSQIGVLDKVPSRLIGVQASAGAPIVAGFRRGLYRAIRTSTSGSFATDISVKHPLMAYGAIRSIRESGGQAIDVSDKEILDATMMLAKCEGVFAEPAAASTIAAVTKLMRHGSLERDAEVVCIITGAGLKDPTTARRMLGRTEGARILSLVPQSPVISKIGGTKLRILELLSKRESYGYGIWRNLSKQRQLRIPSVYQHLFEMQRAGLIRETRKVRVLGRPDRRYYGITARGEKLLPAVLRG